MLHLRHCFSQCMPAGSSMHALGCLTLSPGLLLTHGLPWRRTSEDLEAVLRVNVIGAYLNCS